jgi:hypothetical protein
MPKTERRAVLGMDRLVAKGGLAVGGGGGTVPPFGLFQLMVAKDSWLQKGGFGC